MTTNDIGTTIPYHEIEPHLHGIVRAMNALGARTVGSCWQMVNYKEYGLPQPDGEPDEYESWYVEFVLPRDGQGWLLLADIAHRLQGTDALIQVWPGASANDVVLHLYSGDNTDIADVERRLS